MGTAKLPSNAGNLRAIVDAHFRESIEVSETFFTAEGSNISQACWAMARRFHVGGRLLAFGNGAAATDAQHVAVEFVHPVIVGKRALPALSLTNDSAALSNLDRGAPHTGVPFAHYLKLISRPQDIAMGFSTDGRCPNVLEALENAQKRGLLTVGLTGGDGAEIARAGIDFSFVVPSDDPFVVQETHETLYHVLWELVHIFFEHEGLLTS